ncbi:MAG: sigma-70 family RNA polymerase sigma factor [Synergistaceae bacterium]|jgi:RNA polymerase sigma factor (sigma-70 family)|nr:sigma-70 family RNA polymerase sigma factor [Synergistaceae bacterium]
MLNKISTRDNKFSRGPRRRAPKIVRENALMIARLASRYEGRGAEKDDLVQEGYLAVLNAQRDYAQNEAKRVLDSSLRGIVRDAADRLRWKPCVLPIAKCLDDEDGAAISALTEENIPDERAERDVARLELEDALERALEPDDMDIAVKLLDGFTHKDIAQKLGVTQQAATARIHRLRRPLAPLRK